MLSVEPCTLPADALLGVYRSQGAYTDCYTTRIQRPVSHEQFVVAFYTTPVFKLERLILALAVAKPSTDEGARLLAAGKVQEFAAWRVERRSEDQLLLCDYMGRTRSWLMVAPLAQGQTRLYFGSAVTRRKADAPGIGTGFSAMLGFHRVYSQVLLRAAKARLERQGTAG